MTKVKDIMNTAVVTIKAEEPISKALKIMEEENINGTPVVDDYGRLLGMIVKADIYRFLIAPGHYDSCPVDWVMTKDVVHSHKEETLEVLAKRLRKKDIIAMPIVEDEMVVGIISIEDLVDYYMDKYHRIT